jgi:hypothetical protein
MTAMKKINNIICNKDICPVKKTSDIIGQK